MKIGKVVAFFDSILFANFIYISAVCTLRIFQSDENNYVRVCFEANSTTKTKQKPTINTGRKKNTHKQKPKKHSKNTKLSIETRNSHKHYKITCNFRSCCWLRFFFHCYLLLLFDAFHFGETMGIFRLYHAGSLVFIKSLSIKFDAAFRVNNNNNKIHVKKKNKYTHTVVSIGSRSSENDRKCNIRNNIFANDFCTIL